MEIISRNYEHFNRAMGKHIRSRKHYEEEMRKGGYVTDEESRRRAAKEQRDLRKPYELSSTAQSVIECARSATDKNGNVRLSDRLIDGMKKVGVNFKTPDIPK